MAEKKHVKCILQPALAMISCFCYTFQGERCTKINFWPCPAPETGWIWGCWSPQRNWWTQECWWGKETVSELNQCHQGRLTPSFLKLAGPAAEHAHQQGDVAQSQEPKTASWPWASIKFSGAQRTAGEPGDVVLALTLAEGVLFQWINNAAF